MDRALGIFEGSQWLTDELFTFNGIGVLRLRRGPAPGVLRQALSTLQQEQPALQCRVVQRKGRAWFSAGAPEIPLEVVPRSRDDQWLELVDQELVRRLDSSTGPLMRCCYLAPHDEEGTAELVLTVHHLIVDGESGIRLCHRLLRLCAGDDENLPDGQPPGALSPPTEALLPATFQGLARYRRCLGFTLRQMADELLYQARTLGRRRPPIDLTSRCRPLTVSLDEETTAAVVRQARRRRVSLNSVISACMLLAVQRHLYDGAARPYRYFTMAGMRPYLQPPLGPEQLASHFAMLRFTIGLAADEKLWALTERINQQVYRAARRGDKHCALLMSGIMVPLMYRLRSDRMATTATSYAGAPRLAPSYGPITVDGLHVFVSTFGLAPEYSAQVRLWQGRLHWDIVYLERDMDLAMAKTIQAEMLGLLRSGVE